MHSAAIFYMLYENAERKLHKAAQLNTKIAELSGKRRKSHKNHT